MECDKLLLAAKVGDIATIETLIYTKYIDVNSRTPWDIQNDDVCITGYHIATYVCIVIKWCMVIYACMYGEIEGMVIVRFIQL